MEPTDENTPQASLRQDRRNTEIARRAYDISLGSDGGTPDENWHRAERELTQPSDEPKTN
jgi:hypothetical protein